MWVDLSKRNASEPDLVFTCNNSIEEVLHSDFYGRNCISSACRAQKVRMRQKAYGTSYMLGTTSVLYSALSYFSGSNYVKGLLSEAEVKAMQDWAEKMSYANAVILPSIVC